MPLLKAAEMVWPEHKQAFANFRITRNTVAQHVKNMAENFQDKLLVTFSIAANENTDINNGTLLAIFICDILRILEESKNF